MARRKTTQATVKTVNSNGSTKAVIVTDNDNDVMFLKANGTIIAETSNYFLSDKDERKEAEAYLMKIAKVKGLTVI